MEITRTLPTMQVQMYNQDTNQVAEAVKIIVDKKKGTVADYTWAQLFQQVCAEVEIALVGVSN